MSRMLRDCLFIGSVLGRARHVWCENEGRMGKEKNTFRTASPRKLQEKEKDDNIVNVSLAPEGVVLAPALEESDVPTVNVAQELADDNDMQRLMSEDQLEEELKDYQLELERAGVLQETQYRLWYLPSDKALKAMGAKMKIEKSSLIFLSSKRTKEDISTRADKAFVFLSFATEATSIIQELPWHMYREVATEQHSQNDVEILKQTMLKHEAMFREQVCELHRLYQVQRLMMVETKRKDLAIFDYSALPSSSKGSLPCSLSYNSIKLAVETKFWHASNEPLNVSRHDQKDLIPKSEQGFPTTNLENNLSRDVVGNFEHSVQSSIKVARRAFDLEQPAEDYMDELEEENLQKEHILQMGVKQSVSEFWSKPANDIPIRENEVHLRLGTGWDSNVDVPPTNNPIISLEEFIRGEKRLLTCPRSSEGIYFFPMASMRNEGLSQEAPFCPIPILPSKRHLGVLLGLNQESWRDNVSMPDMLKRDIEDEGRKKEGLSLNLEAGDRSTQENPKKPHWLLQDLSLNRKFSFF